VSGARLAMNVLAFQAAWLGTVGGAAVGRPWIGPVAAVAVVACHVAIAAQPRRELGAIVAAAALGTAWDIVPAALGLIEYRGGVAALGGAPLWIAALWLAFATTLNVSLRWLRTRRVLAIALGAVFGPLCYQAGAALGALQLVEPYAALGVQAVAWAVLLPLAVAMAARYDGVQLPARVEHAHV
jgi:Protein of unknown function (DUF2878)